MMVRLSIFNRLLLVKVGLDLRHVEVVALLDLLHRDVSFAYLQLLLPILGQLHNHIDLLVHLVHYDLGVASFVDFLVIGLL